MKIDHDQKITLVKLSFRRTELNYNLTPLQKKIIDAVLEHQINSSNKHYFLPAGLPLKDRKLIAQFCSEANEYLVTYFNKSGVRTLTMPVSLSTKNRELDLNLMNAGLMDLPSYFRKEVVQIVQIIHEAKQNEKGAILSENLIKLFDEPEIVDFFENFFHGETDLNTALIYSTKEDTEFNELMYGVD